LVDGGCIAPQSDTETISNNFRMKNLKKVKMTSENSLADQVKTLQGYMGRFAKTIKDLTERVNNLENNKKSDDEREIKEIVESQRVIDDFVSTQIQPTAQFNRI
jgi:hypothetical protein